MRPREKGEESHTDYKGIPILVVKKRGHRRDNVTKHTMKLLSPNYLACIQEQSNLGRWGQAEAGEDRGADVCEKKAKLVSLL